MNIFMESSQTQKALVIKCILADRDFARKLNDIDTNGVGKRYKFC